MNIHPKWGHPRADQVEARCSELWVTTQEPERRTWFGRVLPARKKKQLVRGDHRLSAGAAIPDEADCWQRRFRYRCGLIKAINVLAGSHSTFTLYLDGFANFTLELHRTTFEFDPAVGDEPVCVIHYQGWGTRYGELTNYSVNQVDLIFRDHEQMRQFIVATTSAPSARTSTQTVHHHHDDSGSAVWPLAAGVVLGAVLSD